MDGNLKEILKKVRHIEVSTKRLVNEALAGQYHSVFKGAGMNFDAVREYVQGDEVKRIDWNVTARAGVPYIKEFTEERELTIMLMVDVSASKEFGSGDKTKRELVAEVSAALAFSAIKNNDNVGLILFTDEVELYVPPRKGKSHVLRIIKEILSFKPKGKMTDIHGAVDFLNRVTNRKAVTFIISDFKFNENYEQALEDVKSKFRILSKKHDAVAVTIVDPHENSLPDIGLVVLEDAETGEQIEINTSDKAVRDAYEAEALKKESIIESGLRNSGVDLLKVSTAEEVVVPLKRFFKERVSRR
jgi:uncharacterized protein (DUF58 family)